VTDAPPTIGFVAGEASGDLLAAPVVAALRERVPGLRAVGLAGDRMIGAGCEAWHHVRELSVRGYVEVLRELPRLLRLRRALSGRLRAERCAAVVGVDSPDFNLRMESGLRAAGMRTVHYVSPSIWAWRAGRIERIRRAADRVLLVFPFEEEIYRRAGIPATYVGHPLASQIPRRPNRVAARDLLELPREGPVIALLPGSRRAEILHIAPVVLGAALAIARSHPGTHFVLPIADPSLGMLFDALLAVDGVGPRLGGRLHLYDGRSHECLAASDGAILASGTATLEAALFGLPMVIVYRMPWLSAWIMRRIGSYLPWVGLPNILANESLVPELLQEHANADEVAHAMLTLLEDAPRCARIVERFSLLHESLARDTASLAAEAILATAAGR